MKKEQNVPKMFYESDCLIGDRILSRRLEKGLTEIELYIKLFGYSEDNKDESMKKRIRNWEQGIRQPSIKDLTALCNALECDVDYLLGKIDTPSYVNVDCSKALGLSKEAIDTIRNLKYVTFLRDRAEKPSGLKPLGYMDTLNAILTTRKGIGTQILLDGISRFIHPTFTNVFDIKEKKDSPSNCVFLSKGDGSEEISGFYVDETLLDYLAMENIKEGLKQVREDYENRKGKDNGNASKER